MPDWQIGDIVRRTVNPAVALEWTVTEINEWSTWITRNGDSSWEQNRNLELVRRTEAPDA